MGIVLKGNQDGVVATHDMKPGDFAVVTEGVCLGHILLRNDGCGSSKLIDLTEVKSWAYVPEFKVRILPPGTSFQIE